MHGVEGMSAPGLILWRLETHFEPQHKSVDIELTISVSALAFMV